MHAHVHYINKEPARYIFKVNVPGLEKPVNVDVAFGGMWYAIVDVSSIPGLEIVPEQGKKLAEIGEMIKASMYVYSKTTTNDLVVVSLRMGN